MDAVDILNKKIAELQQANAEKGRVIEKVLEMVQCARLPVRLNSTKCGQALHYIDKAIEALKELTTTQERGARSE